MSHCKRLFIDYSKCIGCETCEQVCKFVRSQPRIHMTRTTDGVSVPLYCQHCDKPRCVAACPSQALYKDDSGAVLLKAIRCASCETRECISACPYGAIYCSGRQAPVLKCDLCARRRQEGLEPACVEMCPSQAIMYVDRKEVRALQTRESVAAFKRVMAHLRPPVWPKGVPGKRPVEILQEGCDTRAMLRMTDLDLAGRRVMIREDLNVPVQDGRVVNDRRIRAALPTIRFALEAGAGVMLVSHLGRPSHGVFDESLSLEPVAEHLSELLERPVTLVPDWLEGLSINPGQVVLLENVRFLKGENANDPELGRRMAGLCDVFVMDAFGAAHRVQASTNAVIRSAPTACAGLLLTRELEFLSGALRQPPRPLTAVVGGSKVATALSVLESLCVKADQVILGGAVANTFLASAGVNVGRSLFEPGLVSRAEEIRNVAQDAGTLLPLPVDVVCAPALSSEARARVKQLGQIEDGDMILDIGPQTVRKYVALLAEAGTIVWNGPMGVSEHGQFCAGTRALATAMAESPAMTIAGGGETLAAIDSLGIHDRLSFVSTGGGAFLKFLDGKKLPAVRLLEERAGYCLL